MGEKPYPSSYSNKPIKKVDLPEKITEPIVGIMSLYGSDGVKFLSFDRHTTDEPVIRRHTGIL